jgi:DNA-directed RNA polymerase subunit RPC12/RpoP
MKGKNPNKKRKNSFKIGHKSGMFGKKHTNETIIKMKLNHKGGIKKGDKLSLEHKTKISNSLKGRKAPWVRQRLLGLKGRKNFNYKHGKPKCMDCGKKLSTYNANRCKLCNIKYLSGKNHPMWNGGVSKRGYSFEFNKTLKEKILKRDNYQCQLCGFSNEKSKQIYKRILSVNHIDFNKQNNNESNLNSLCCFCNSSINTKRDFFSKYFKAKLENKEKEISKNIETVYSFKHYCYLNKNLRFWQALASWSGYNFIYGSNAPEHEITPTLEDTFYIEDK